MSIQYYLGNLGFENDSTEQAKQLRSIVLSNKSETEILTEFTQFILSQNELNSDTVLLINRALMTQYGSEYLGLGKDDYQLKSDLYKQFINKFVEIFSFKIYYADSCLLAGITLEQFYPILKEGMLQDKENINYPSADLFEIIHESEFSFDFDILLLEKYYQPCSKVEFDEWISEYTEQYKSKEQQVIIENLKWKGNDVSSKI